MKAQIILALLILTGMGAAGTYQLGSHNVSINLDIPVNYTQEIPIYSQDLGTWTYTLNMTPNSGGYVSIILSDYSMPIYGSRLINGVAGDLVNNYTKRGLGGLKYRTLAYQGHDAFEISAPAQRINDGDVSWTWPEFHTLIYQPDETVGATITAINTGELVFNKVLNATKITRVDIRG